MPTTKSAKKRMKTSHEKQIRNTRTKNKIKSSRKELYKIIESGDKEKSVQKFKEYCSVVDRATKNGVLKANTASRKKSRASAHLKKMV
ncbi:30S ribosomal protein S20 [Verrucomicrobiota bacterium]